MKRRIFLKKTAIAATAAGSLNLFFPMITSGMSSKKLSRISNRFSGQLRAAQQEIRSAGYLRRVRADKYLPAPPVFVESYQQAAVQVLPMPLKERLRRNIVPQHGFCSIAPGKTVNEGLTSGNGAMNIEMTCDPYSEQILFHHESLLMPWRRPIEAPNAAGIFPQVRQMVMDGKYKEAVEFAFSEMEKGPIKLNTFGHLTIPAFQMRLDFPKTTSVKDYLRTVDFESSEAKVYWNDERGQWLRQTFTSRPDNVVVQLITAPNGQSVNTRIALSDPARRFRPNVAFKQKINQATDNGESEIKRDFNEQRLIYK